MASWKRNSLKSSRLIVEEVSGPSGSKFNQSAGRPLPFRQPTFALLTNPIGVFLSKTASSGVSNKAGRTLSRKETQFALDFGDLGPDVDSVARRSRPVLCPHLHDGFDRINRDGRLGDLGDVPHDDEVVADLDDLVGCGSSGSKKVIVKAEPSSFSDTDWPTLSQKKRPLAS